MEIFVFRERRQFSIGKNDDLRAFLYRGDRVGREFVERCLQATVEEH